MKTLMAQKMSLAKEAETRIPILNPATKRETYEEFSGRLKFEYSVITANISCNFRRGKRVLNKSNCKINKFIRCLTSTEDKSAEISFVLKKFSLWNNEEFWKEIRLEDVMRFYARNYCHYDIREDERGGGQNEAIIKNLFSILIYDWNKPYQHQENYFLKLKFDKFASASTLNLFQILYDVLNRRHLAGYHHICLLVIYHYLFEVSKYEGEWSDDFELTRLGSINDVLIMHNTEYQIEILKILVVHWNVDYWRIHAATAEDEYNFTSFRQKKMEYESYKQSIFYLFNGHKPDNFSHYTKLANSKQECNKQFFHLAFLLKELTPKKFETEFENYVKFYQKTNGEYWKIAIKSDVHLLLRIADGLELFKTVEFMFKKCPFIALNWNILMNFEDIGEFRAILNRPFKKNELKKMNSIEIEFQKIEDAFGRYADEPPPPDIFVTTYHPPATNFVRDKFMSINSFTSDDSFKSTKHTNDLDMELRSFETISDVFFETESVYRMKNNQFITSMKVKFLKSCFKNLRRDRRIFFGRTSANHLSMFEQILRTSAGSSFVNYVWNEFNLWAIPELLTMINPMNKTLLHYAIESRDDLNLMTFLLPRVTHKVEFKRHKHNMHALNNLYFSITEKTIFDFYLEVSMDDHSGEEDYQGLFCRHIIHLLEEIGTIAKVTRDPLIDKLIHLAEDEYFYEKIVRRESKLKIHSMGDRRKEKFHIDDLLGRMIVYWKPNGDEKIKGNFYPAYKRRLTNISPFYELMFYIIEHRAKLFKNGFRSKIHKLEMFYERRYNDVANTEYHTSSLTFIMLLAAIQSSEKGIINFIFNQDIFETIKFEFPSNMNVTEIHQFTALMLLKNGYELGKKAIPEEWITPSVLNHFLDLQVKYQNQELIEIDCSCLLHAETKKTVVRYANDLTDKMLLWDDDRTLEYILTHKNISEVIIHPVIATFIDLKYTKYQLIFRMNFWTFVLFFVLPFSLFIFYNNEDVSWQLYTLCIFGIASFVAKEIFQYKIAQSSRNYLQDLTNKIDIPLLLLSILLLFARILDWSAEVQSLIEVIFVFIMIWDAMTMLPVEAVSRTLQIIKKVIKTFARVFCSFALILFAFAISFRILFGNDQLDGIKITSENSTVFEVPEREPNMKNFESISTTFVKVLVMMAGEYTIEPSNLKWYQLILFGIFVVFSFIIFNLLLGMSIEDIQNLRENSLRHDLERKARKIIEMNDKFEQIYAEHVLNGSNKSLTISFSNRLIYRLSIFFLSQYIFLHNFRRIYINLRTREVTVNINGKQKKIMKRFIKYFTRKHFTSKESLEKIYDIISIRDQENCVNVVRRQ